MGVEIPTLTPFEKDQDAFINAVSDFVSARQVVEKMLSYCKSEQEKEDMKRSLDSMHLNLMGMGYKWLKIWQLNPKYYGGNKKKR